MGDPSDVEISPPSAPLKVKARPMTAKDRDALIAQAEGALHKLRGQFVDWMQEEADRLADAFSDWRRAGADASDKRLDFFRAAHDIKGQAATLGYPIVGRIAASLCRLVWLDTVPHHVAEQTMERHVDAIRAAIREEARGDDHPVAGELAAELEQIVGAMMPEAPDPAASTENTPEESPA